MITSRILSLFIVPFLHLIGHSVSQDAVVTEQPYREDVRYFDIGDILNPKPSEQGFLSYMDDQSPPTNLHFDTGNHQNIQFTNTIVGSKVTMNRFIKVSATDYYQLTLLDDRILRVVKINEFTLTTLVDNLELYTTAANTVCTDADLYGSDIYVICIKVTAVPAEEMYYVEKVTMRDPPPIPSTPLVRTTIQFPPTSVNYKLSVNQATIRVDLFQAGTLGATLHNGIPVDMANTMGNGVQPSTKYVYLMDLKESTPTKPKVTVTSLSDAILVGTSTTKFDCNFLSNINMFADASGYRLYAIGMVADLKLVLFSFTYEQPSQGDWKITKYEVRAKTTATAQTPLHLDFSLNIQTIRLISAKTVYFLDYTVSLTGTDTITEPQIVTKVFKGKDFPSRVDECFEGTIDSQIRICTQIYDETFDSSPFTVFELSYIQPDKLKGGNTLKVDRIYKNYYSTGVYYLNVNDPRALVAERSWYLWYFNTDADLTKVKRNNLVLNYAKFPTTVEPAPYVQCVIQGGQQQGQTFKFTSKNLLWQLEVPSFVYKANWYLGKWMQVIVDNSAFKGLALKYTVKEENNFEGVVFKDNPASFVYLDLAKPASNNFHLFGSYLFVLGKTGDTGLISYSCPKFANSTSKTIQMNCSSKSTLATLKSINTLVRYELMAGGVYFMLFKEAAAVHNLVTFKDNKLYSLGLTDEIIDSQFQQIAPGGSQPATYFFCSLVKVAGKFVVKVNSIDSNGTVLTLVADSDPAVVVLNNPTMIARFEANTAVVILDFKADGPTPVLVFLKFDANKKLLVEKSRDFWRTGMELDTNIKVCLFSNNQLLYWYNSNPKKVAWVIPNIESNTYEMFSTALTELKITEVKDIACNFTSNTFALVGLTATGTVVAGYDALKMKSVDNRLLFYSELGTDIQTVTPFFEEPAWYFSGSSKQAAGSVVEYARVFNTTAPLIFIRNKGPATGELTGTISVSNPSLSKDFPVKITFNPLPTTFPSENKNIGGLQAGKSFPLHQVLALNGHVMEAAIQATTPQDAALVKLTPRIVFDKVMEDSPAKRRVLEERAPADLPKSYPFNQKMISEKSIFSLGQNPVVPSAKIIKVKGKLTIVMVDSVSDLRLYLYNMTDKFEKSFEQLGATCSAFDFVLQDPTTVHLFTYCADNKMRYYRFSADKLVTSFVFFDSGNTAPTLTVGDLKLGTDPTFTKFYIVLFDSASKALKIFNTEILASQTTGSFALTEKESFSQGRPVLPPQPPSSVRSTST